MKRIYKTNLSLEYRISKLEKLFLNEAKQVGTLYHVCTLDAYLKYILPSDTLSASGKYDNFLYGGNNYVSFTRDKNFVVSTNTVANASVLIRLVVDGDKLSEKYKIGPYNDFAYNTNTGKLDTENDCPQNREMEEAVKGPIKNISKYIKEINFDVCEMSDKIISDLKNLLSKNSNIVYKHFVKGNESYTRLLKDSKIQNGDPLQSAIPLLEDVIKNDAEPLLFSDDIDQIKQAIKSKADLNKKYSKGYPLVYYAAKPDTSEIVNLLIKNGADVNISQENNPPICAAARSNGDLNTVKLLVKNNADINSTNKQGWTPLMCASRRGNIEIVKYLIDSDADVNYTNKSNNNALDLTKNQDIKDLLKNAGAK